MLLSTPFPLLCPSRYAVGLARHSRLALAASLPTAPPFHCNRSYGPLPVSPQRQRSSFSLRVGEFHSSTTDRVDYEQLPQTAKTVNAWPEWSRFVEHVTAREYGSKRSFLSAAAASDDNDDDSFAASCHLPEDFARAAEACLAFARERPVLLKLLSKENVKVLVDNGSPFLFNNGLNSSRRMSRFLSNEGLSLSETEAAKTVDLMRYLLSYLYSQLVSSKVGSFSATKFVEASVNDLLNDMVKTSNPVQGSHVNMSSSSYEQNSWPPSQNIEMKRGDWICPKCSYINFARNMKCLKCDEGRPRRRPTGAEWECPQCDFYNYGRNLACLRCDCKRPLSASNESNPGYMRESSLEQIRSQDSASTSGVAWPLLHKDKKVERRFGKVAEASNSSVFNSATADEDFSEIMSQKGPSGLANTTKHSGPPAEGSASLSINISDRGLDSSITRSLEMILCQSSTASGSVSTSETNDNASTRFVPSTPGMFRNNKSPNIQEKHLGNGVHSPKGDLQDVPNRVHSGQPGSAPHYEISQSFNNDKEMFNSSKNTSEHYDRNQTDSVSDNDFPEIMPMRKGENRFVVSRKKDRSLTSPQYKRRLAMEQAGGSNFVPFVPFPPGYFARKDKPGGDGVPTSSETVSSVHGKSEAAETTDPNGVAESGASQTSPGSWNSFGRNPSVNSKINPASAGGFNSSPLNDDTWNKNEMRTMDDSQVGSSPVGAGNSNTLWNNNNNATSFTGGVDSRSRVSVNREPTSSWNRDQENWNTGFPGKNQPNDTHTSANLNSHWNKSEQSSSNGYSSWNSSNGADTDGKAKTKSGKGSSWGFTGKSLEGSAVPEEPDPLDMSEEAKAQRWFRRVAQITDISELSKIPDEDFPEIMPMRKGVNRFVVSKRKTPLERRLTSPQYRRNLPTVSSDPEKDTNKQF